MKRDSKARFNNIELYKAMDDYYDNPEAEAMCKKAGIKMPPLEDTRYYGVFITGARGKRKIQIDPKRFKEKLGLPKEADAVLAKRTGHYFVPAKEDFYDYNCNIFFDAIAKIKKDWQTEHKPIIDRAIKDIPDAEYQFDDLCGALEPDEAMMNSTFLHNQATARVEARRKRLHLSLYAQFFHQMVSSIEAITVSVLTHNGYEGDRFDRNVLYAFKGANQEKIKELKGFAEYDKLYAIWHFIKHNSKSTYDAVLSLCPEILVKDPWDKKKLLEYKQGNLAIYHIHFTNQLIEKLLKGVTTFFMEYCRVVFGENYDEAQWNYNGYFLSQVNGEIESFRNPLGIPPWI
jgi:hypothetical protein